MHDMWKRRLYELPSRNWTKCFNQIRFQTKLDILNQYFFERLQKECIQITIAKKKLSTRNTLQASFSSFVENIRWIKNIHEKKDNN